MEQKKVSFTLVSSLDELTKAVFVRGCVFVEELGVAYKDEFDGSDQSAMHVLGYCDGEPFATLRLRHIDGYARVERICVRRSFRGKGLGDRLLSSAISLAEQNGLAEFSVLAEGRFVQWYRNHGFEIAQTIKDSKGSECFEMLRSSSRSKAAPTTKTTSTSLEHMVENTPITDTESKPKEGSPQPQETCAISGKSFEVREQDREYYKKLGVPAPRLCPEERARRRMAFANQRNLFVRNCAGSKKRIITNYPPESDVPIYDLEYWYSDKWDKFSTGKEFDFTRPFFEQFQELMRVAPRPNLQRAYSFDENADYTNYAGENKNCYLIFDSDKNRDCYHSYSINSCEDVIDCFRIEKSQLCYECVDCTNCYSSLFLQNCDNCSDSSFLQNCIGCSYCFGSVNLRNKTYYFMNEKCSKKDYFEKLNKVQLERYGKLKNLRSHMLEYASQFPHRSVQGIHNEETVGDYLTNCKNAWHCFDSRNLWDCSYIIQAFDDAKDCMDCTEVGYGAELLYECCYVGYTAHSNRFCSHALGNSANLSYCYYTPYCSDCFGCIGIHHATHSILNKQYSETEYKKLSAKIIKHMEKTGEWGEFFPAELSPFPYNLTHAHEYYPLTKADAIKRGYSWRNEEEKEYQPSSYRIPETIAEVNDDILAEVLACDTTGKNYKIQKPELGLYRKMNIPIPRLCPDERHFRRLKMRNSRELFKRTCSASGKEIFSTIPPSSPIHVYSEEEFLKQLD